MPIKITAVIVGLTGIIVETLLIRELLVVCEGNELSLGIIFSSWLLFEAIGSFYLGKEISKRKNKIFFFVILQLLFVIFSISSLYLTRNIKSFLGIELGVGVSLQNIFIVVATIIALPSFFHGGLYTCLVKMFSLNKKDIETSLPMAYIFELMGAVVGGVVFTFLLIKYLFSFQIVFLVSILSLLGIILLLIYKRDKLSTLVVIFMFLCIFTAYIFNFPSKVEYKTTKDIWKGFKLLEFKNSIYGKVVVVEREAQKVIYYNSIPIFTIPVSDKTFYEELVHIPLSLVTLNNKEKINVLIIYGGLSGLLYEFLKYNTLDIDYVEPDSVLVNTTLQLLDNKTKTDITTNKNVNIHNIDPRVFVKKHTKKYKLVIIGMKEITDINTNKIFTYEFFKLLKNNLYKDSVVVFTTVGSLVYLHKELVKLNSIIYNTVSSVFNFVNVIPADSYNLFLCSDSDVVFKLTPETILYNMKLNKINSEVLTKYYLEYRLNENLKHKFLEDINKIKKIINRDFSVAGLTSMLCYWSIKNTSSVGSKFVSLFFDKTNLRYLVFIMFFIILLYLWLFRNKQNYIVYYSIFTTGYIGMFLNILLMFVFQTVYGYIYHLVGILNSLFMGAAALSCFFSEKFLKKTKLIFCEICIVVLTFFISLIIKFLYKEMFVSYFIFVLVFVLGGLIVGLEIPVFNKLLLTSEVAIPESRIFGIDTLGGWLGGILGGVFLLFVVGIKESVAFILGMKLIGILFMFLFAKNV